MALAAEVPFPLLWQPVNKDRTWKEGKCSLKTTWIDDPDIPGVLANCLMTKSPRRRGPEVQTTN